MTATTLSNFVFDADNGAALAVRSLMIDGAPWFVAADVCNALDIKNVTQAVDRLDEDDKAMFNIGLPGRDPYFVNESGLYSLILGSRKPEARRFKKWVTSEVLPAIRQTGRYVDPGAIGAGAAGEGGQYFSSHRADLLVAADRIYRSVLRAGGASGLGRAAALRLANQRALEHTGINLLAELNLPEPQDPPPPPEPDPATAPELAHHQFIAAWQAGELVLKEGQAPLPFVPCQGSHLHAAYLAWWQRQGLGAWPLAVTSFISWLDRQPGWRAGHPSATLIRLGSKVPKKRRMVLPSPALLAAAAAAGVSTLAQGSLPATHWRTACFERFRAALLAAGVSLKGCGP